MPDKKPRQYRTRRTLEKAYAEGRIAHDEYLRQSLRLGTAAVQAEQRRKRGDS